MGSSPIRRVAVVAAVLSALLVLLALVVAVNTLRQRPQPAAATAALAPLAVDARAAAESLAVAVRARTVSGGAEAGVDDATKAQALDALHAHLRQRYPLVHERLEREVVGSHGLLYTWRGSDPAARPFALLAHQDVAPVAPGTDGDWTHPPFSGALADGHVWGRGTWDDKGNLIAQLEAVERLLRDGHVPRRTVHLVFGHDEEVGGADGAARIAALLRERGVRLDFVLDEGLVITQGIVPGLKRPAALIGVAEKGFVSVELTVESPPGHSSMPPPPATGAIAVLAAALQRIDARPVPGGIDGVARGMFEALAPEMGGVSRVALTNLWLFRPLVERMLSRQPGTNAMMRTTTALTVVAAGNKPNVLPGRARAVVDFRLLPGDDAPSIVEFVRRTVDDDRVRVRALPGHAEPSRVSSTDSDAYRLVERTVRELFPQVIVAPGLMIGGTDARHFEPIADQVLRFTPVWATAEDLKRFHGTDERLSVENLADLVRYYHRIVAQASTR